MICGDANVCCPLFKELGDCVEHPGDRAERWISFLKAPQSVEVTKEFIGAVNEVDDHYRSLESI